MIPSFVLLAAGVGINAYLITAAVQKRDTAILLARGYSLAVPFMPAMTQERRASVAAAADPSPENRAALDQSRGAFNQLMAQFSQISTEVADAMPPESRAAIGRFVQSMGQVPQIRAQIDNGQASRLTVYSTYNSIADAMIVAAGAIGRDSTDKDAALLRSSAADLMRVSDWLDRSNSLALAAYRNGGLTGAELAEYDSLTRAYRAELNGLRPQLPVAQQQKIGQLESSSDWALLGTVEDALVRQGFDPRPLSPGAVPSLPVTVQQWQDAVRQVASTISGFGLGDLGSTAAAAEKQSADDTLLRSVLIAAASLLLAVVVLSLAVRMGNGLVRRLRQLRSDTLAADERLPLVVDRIRQGEQVDVAEEMPALDYGRDEVGEVAEAFTKAQQAAVAAAVQEARLREGTNTVFLNIARRSQAVVHRQLQVLDKAERAADDPEQVELLYLLDHLSTRERRNAENLIVLGGGRLTRQWRTSVSLLDIVRSAVAETEQYNRISFGRIPQLQITGQAVADLMHLLAELVDNAIAFSPPESRIEVRGNPVGKGAVIEIDDQGLGMAPEDRSRANDMFGDPPDFGMLALTGDSRIGFYVVARLARQHDIRVSLLESNYGGVRAVVLIPNSALVPVQRLDSGDDRHTDWFDTVVPAQESRVEAGAPRRTTVAMLPEGNPAWPALPPSDDRPPLPKRHRQANLAPELHELPEPEPVAGDHEATAVEARSLMTAFQDGTRRGRADNETWDG
ncbi:ATP-binding protein [Amycolatopsis acidiphila]|uniref:histidine kinase n=1 Tax=Amycolatopsis acidiphila TaxID=715473 RepID=A0A558A506_9PSEU|nr:ATP-binding protein [Amycolatopsis acidiphila]TVT19354.1 HAMP domain-containing protein [Amycolatopsis acidiphila]UIJ61719.1 ATP-binding protein [Amycolatopsis acidiphila]GHG58232.1 histidine kinase [Amycolatopsis acidiphila]